MQEDHVHLVIVIPPTIAVANTIQFIGKDWVGKGVKGANCIFYKRHMLGKVASIS